MWSIDMAGSGSYFEHLIPMSSLDGIKCYKKLEYCPKGHEMDVCEVAGEQGRYCKQCGEFTFQPNQNKFGDQCRFKITCSKYKMRYKIHGDKTTDAECECEPGFHFQNEDQRNCVPNRECGQGYGQGVYESLALTGTCENCLEKNMFSDTISAVDKCKPLRNCEKESRCTIIKSNGTFDNKCGPKVRDVNDCDRLIQETTSLDSSSDDNTANTATIVGALVGGVLLLVLLVVVIVWCVNRRKQRARRRQWRQEELESMLPEITKRSRKDEVFCKKVLDLLQREVEDRINNQIWALAQELFANHLEPAKYEVLLEKYKDTQHKYAINGYMQDWRGWRGNHGDAVEELVTCLQNVKRDDIVLEVVSQLREDFPEVVEELCESKKRSPKPGSRGRCAMLFPCMCKDDTQDLYECKGTSKPFLSEKTVNETGRDDQPPASPPNNLPPFGPPGNGGQGEIAPSEAGVIYRSAATPSAPVLDGDELYPDIEYKGQHFYDRSDSVPVQAIS